VLAHGHYSLTPGYYRSAFQASKRWRAEASANGLNPNSEVGRKKPGNALIGNRLGKQRRGKFVPAGCRRGAHEVTHPTAQGARQVLSISLRISEFWLN